MTKLNSPHLDWQNPWAKMTSMAQRLEPLQIIVSGANNGGCTCVVEGLRGFIPTSLLDSPPILKNQLIGKTLEVIPTEVDFENKRLVLSEKKAIQRKYFTSLKQGEIIDGRIHKIIPKGFLVDLGKNVRGLLMQSSLDQFLNVDISSLTEGKTISVLIIAKHDDGNIDLELNNNFSGKSEQVLSKEILKISGQFFLSKACASFVKQLSSGINLSDVDFTVFRCLWQKRGETVLYEYILQELGKSNAEIEIVRSSVHRLRSIISESKINIDINNEREKGYRLVERL